MKSGEDGDNIFYKHILQAHFSKNGHEIAWIADIMGTKSFLENNQSRRTCNKQVLEINQTDGAK